MRESPALAGLARLGLATRGVLYLVVGLVALRIAFGATGDEADKQGAFEAVARQSFGRFLLVVLVVGLAGYALWRVAQAVLGAGDEDELEGWAKRAVYIGRAVMYGALSWSAATVLNRASEAEARDRQGSEEEREWTARVLEWPAGRAIVVTAGFVVIGVGVYHCLRAVEQKWRKRLDLSGTTPVMRRTIGVVAATGLMSRGLVHVLIGLFLIRAGWEYDPDEAVGIDGALRELADRAWGPWLLTAVALGLLSFGVYSMFEARYRRATPT